MSLPTRSEAKNLLESYVTDPYQRYHAEMVGTALEGYAEKFGEDQDLWYLTGYLHDIDFEKHPAEHPGESLKWFKDWQYPEELIHAVEAHAYGYNDFTTEPQTRLAAALLACDEMCGLFYAYQKINPSKYGEMKASSILKRFKEPKFAAKIDRAVIMRGVSMIGITLEEHVHNLIRFLAKLDGKE
jgi:predicted hydrolase (HD superfamily)